MPPKNEKQIVFDETLRSMLMSEARTEGLYSRLDGKKLSKYRVSAGLTEKQAMLAVLGAITEKENLMKLGTRSSSGSVPKMDWTRIWFLRDLTCGDEARGIAVQDAVEAGRKMAAEAFAEMENGDRTKVDRLLKNAADNIRYVYDREAVQDGYLWDNPDAAMRLLEEATEEGGIEEVTGFGKAEQAEIAGKKGISEIMNRHRELCKRYEELPENVPAEERDEMLAEIYACNAILRDHDEHVYGEVGKELTPIAPVDPRMDRKDGDATAKYPEIIAQNRQFSKDYLASHPSVIGQYVGTEEGRKVLLDAYKNGVKQTDFYREKAGQKVSSLGITDLPRFKTDLPDAFSPEERAKMDAAWQRTKREHEKKLNEQAKRAVNFGKTVEGKLKEIADSYHISGMTVVGNELIGQRYNDVGDVLLNRFPLYVTDRDFTKFYSVSMEDDGSFRVEKAEHIEPSPSSTTFAQTYIYAEEMRNALIESDIADKDTRLRSLPSEKGDDEIENLAIDLKTQYLDLRSTITDLAKDASEEKVSAFVQKTEQLKAAASELNNNKNFGNTYGHMPDNLIRFCDCMLKGNEKAKERNAAFKEKIGPRAASSVRNRTEVAKERYAQRQQQEAGQLSVSQVVRPLPDGSRDTEVRANLGFCVDQIVSRSEGKPELKGKYDGFLAALNELGNQTSSLYQRDAEGNLQPMSREAYGNLLSCYEKAMTECEKVRSLETGDKGLDTVVREFSGILVRDFSLLSSVDPTEEKSLPETVGSRRTRRIDISGKEFSTVGAASNVRYAMEMVDNGSGAKGFLTYERSLKFTKDEYAAEFAPVIKDHPEHAEFLTRVRDEMFETQSTSKNDAIHTVVTYCDEQGMLDEWLVPENGESKEELLQKFEDTLGLFLQDAQFTEMQNRETQYKVNNATMGSSITNRNAAMSKMANLLDMPDIIAHSEVVETVKDGKVGKAVFMKAAKGIDHDAIMPEDVANVNEKTGDSPTLLKQIAQLQILDYISGNIDRHQNNFFYQFENNGEKLVGIQGIDNDLSFHNVEKKRDETLTPADISLEGLQVIPKSLADKLETMTPEILRAALSDTRIGDKEIESAFKRLNNVREEIKAGRIRTVEDQEWEKLNLESLAKKGSLFRAVQKEVKGLKETAKKNLEDKQKKEQRRAANPEAEQKKPFGFEKAEALDGINAASLAADAKKAADFESRIAVSQKKINGSSSPQFESLETAVKNYNKLLGSLGSNPTDREYRQIQASLANIEEASRSYIGVKNGKKLSKKTAGRVQLAEEIGQFAKERGAEFKKAFHRKDEIGVEDTNAHLKAQAEQIRRASVSANELGKKYMEYAADEKENPEFRKLMMLGASALDEVTRSIGKGDLSRLNGKNSNALASLLVCSTVIASRVAGGGKPGELEMSIQKNGASKAVSSIANNPKMAELKKNLTVAKLTDMMARKNFREMLNEEPQKKESHANVKQTEKKVGLGK